MIAKGLIALVFLAATAVGSMHAAATAKVTLAAQNHSGQTGTATLVQSGHNVVVTVTMHGIATGISEPAHIHSGTCAKLSPTPKYMLTNVRDGSTSTTIKNVQLASLLGGRYAINVHDPHDLARYVSCGGIK
ncbi:MAG: CHRD domain-containing protein [Candidatus Tyrphobacter sp.]